MDGVFRGIWGGTRHFWEQWRIIRLPDVLAIAFLAGVIYGITSMAQEWTGAPRPAVEIDLSPWALPKYTFYSLSRGIMAYILSLAFTLVYGYWAAKSRVAERLLIPMLDILQSIPVLGFMPGLIIALAAIFPHSNIGVELAAVVMIFTGQAWNMTYSFYYSVKSIPRELAEAATVYRFDWRERLVWVELPSATMGLVWNSMMSMAGGWFFLMICESFVLGDKDYRLPGLGSYMSVAVAKGDTGAMLWAIAAMVAMIVVLDQLFWRPVVVWAQKFRVEEGGAKEEVSSWFLDLLNKSRAIALLDRLLRVMVFERPKHQHRPEKTPGPFSKILRTIPFIAFIVLSLTLVAGALKLIGTVSVLPIEDWVSIISAALLTLGRVMTAVALGTLWTLPVGIAIGVSPRLSRALQPVVQIAASFPAPMLFPAMVALMIFLNIPLGWGSIVLMVFGTHWYILFNIIAGAMAIPADMHEAARSYRLRGWQRFRQLYVPAVLPYLATGWVAAAGGAWNASIVAEYVTHDNQTLTAFGLGSQISMAAERADFPHLAAAVFVMASVVVLLNRTLWQRVYLIAEQRFSINR
ncbi:MAG: ABC transporter permease subunit [Nitrospinae bacterium]|nr:ABC transporter permease subunit [Nitrospinota bacterium]